MPRVSPLSFFVYVALLGTLLAVTDDAFAQQKATSKTPPSLPPSAKGYKLGTAVVPPSPSLLLFKKAIAAYQQKNYARAESLMQQLTTLEPRDAKVWANLGLMRIPQRKWDGAIAAFQKAVAVAPTPKDAGPYWEELTRLYAAGRRWPECENAARKSQTLGGARDPDSVTAYLGVALMSQGKYAAAIPVLEKRKRLRGEPEEAPEIRLLFALRQSGKVREAASAAQKLAARRPKDARVQLLLADLLSLTGDLAGAGAAYTRVYALQPNDPRAAINAAIAAERGGDRATAGAILGKLVARFPNDPNARLQYGMFFFNNPANKPDQFAAAEEQLKVAALRDPKNVKIIAQLGLSVALQGPKRFNEAVNYLHSALALDPNFAQAYLGLGYIAEQKNDAAEAIKNYRQIIAFKKNDEATARARRRLAGILYLTGKKQEAYTEFEQIVALYPNMTGTTALGELASFLLADQEYARAENAYARLAAKLPEEAQVYMGRGKALEGLKRTDEARAQYLRALAIDPKNDTAALLLGGLWESEKKVDEAIKVYEQVLAADPQDERDHNQLRQQLASNYQEQKRIDDALQVLSKLKPQKDDPARAQLLLARPRVLLANNRTAEGIAALRELWNQNRQEDAIGYALAEAQEKDKRFDAAERTLIAILDRHRGGDPQTGLEARMRLGELLESTGRLDDAAKHFEAALTADPSLPRALVELARVREKQKRPNDVGEFLELNALADPNGPADSWTTTLQRFYATNHQPDRWAAFTKRAVERYPNNRPLLRARVAALMPDGLTRPADVQEMETLLTRLLAIDPNDGPGNFYLGRIREAQNKRDEAIAAYQKAAQNATAGDTEAAQALQRLKAPLAPPVPVSPKPPEGNTVRKSENPPGK